jgi:hypothetical protein
MEESCDRKQAGALGPTTGNAGWTEESCDRKQAGALGPTTGNAG